jgi:ATP-binding cassette subfamily B (MDR/TAP) protein 9
MLGGIRTCCFQVAVARLNVRLRKMVFTALIENDIGFFDKVKTGDMLSRLSADTTTMSDLISQNLNGFLWNFVKTIGTLIFILKLSWQLSLTCFIGAPIVFAVGKLYGNYYRKLSTKVQKFMAEANSVAEEALSTIRTVRSFANEDGEIKSYSFKLKLMLKHKIRQALVYCTYDWGVKISELSMTVSMLSFGAHLVTTNQISSGDFISFVIFQLTLGQCLEGLTSVYTGLMSAAGASEKVFEYLDIKPNLQITTRAFESDATKLIGAIEFKNVCFTYPTRPETPVLKNISFSVRPGEVIALVGPSGSGKSSCISLLERFYMPDKGEILIDGLPITDYNHKFIHRVIALVGQEPVLYARKIRDNIAYGLDEEECSENQIINAAKMANAHNFIMDMANQYDTECGERGTAISGGQKQRISIAVTKNLF